MTNFRFIIYKVVISIIEFWQTKIETNIKMEPLTQWSTLFNKHYLFFHFTSFQHYNRSKCQIFDGKPFRNQWILSDSSDWNSFPIKFKVYPNFESVRNSWMHATNGSFWLASLVKVRSFQLSYLWKYFSNKYCSYMYSNCCNTLKFLQWLKHFIV